MTFEEFRRYAVCLDTSFADTFADTLTPATVAVVKKKNDPVCTRVSLGGTREAGFYCTYRGSIAKAIEAATHVLEALHRLRDDAREPEIAPDAGKEFA